MKIAVIIYEYSETRGGAERVATNLVRGLLARGIEVHLFSHKIKGNVESYGVTWHFVPVSSWYSGLKHLTFAKNVKKMLLDQQFDIIHSLSRTYYQDILRIGGGTHLEYLKNMNKNRAWLGRLFSRINPKELAIISLEKRCFERDAYKKIVCVSQRCKEEVMRNFGVLDEDIKVIYNGVDTRTFKPGNRILYRNRIRSAFGLDNKDCLILFVGSGFKRKGLEYLIEALALLPKEHKYKLWVIGRGGIAYYRALARKLRLREKVYFLGERDNVKEFYAGADVFALPTLYDPFPNACLEAMASGLPVITTKIAGVSEIITDGKDSMVIEDGTDVVRMVEKLKILYDTKARESIGKEAAITASKLSWDNNIEANISLYNEVLRSKSFLDK